MARMLKRWESPRKEGRNDKGKGGSARRRQLKKQTQMLRKQLKSKGQISDQGNCPEKFRQSPKKESYTALLFFELQFSDEMPFGNRSKLLRPFGS